MKTCDGEHQADAQCDTCDEDAKRCDYCWEDHPEDQHDDLRDFRVFPEYADSQIMRLCPTCFERTKHRGKYSDEERGDRWES